MMRINKLFLFFAIPCFASISLFAQNADLKVPNKGEEGLKKENKWYDQVAFSGYVDVYFNYLNNNKYGNQQDSSGTFNTYNKQFAVSAVKLSIEKVPVKESPWGFRMDMQNGQNLMYQERPYATTNSSANMQLLQQAYVSFYLPVKKGLVIDVGKMGTHIGNEVLDSKDNWSYTIGYIFFNTIPFIHTGARATLTWTDRLATSLYVYNSAQGTGYGNGGTGFSPANDKLRAIDPGTAPTTTNGVYNGTNSLQNPLFGYHNYNDSMSNYKSLGTQVKWDVVEKKVNLVWNTLYGNDNPSGRIPNNAVYAQAIGSSLDPSVAAPALGIASTTPLAGRPPSQIKRDYWFINHTMLTFYPQDTLAIRLDWTFGQRSGAAAEAAGAYVNGGQTLSTFVNNVNSLAGTSFTLPSSGLVPAGNIPVFRDGNGVKRIYNTYGLFIKKDFTPTWALAFRFEYLDDSRYGGALAVNMPLGYTTPRDRYDLLVKDYLGLRVASNYGQTKTITFTPTYTWSENIIVKLDLRRDYAPGLQFVDPKGRAASHQDGFILGIVAKF